MSLYYSLCDFQMTRPPVYVGAENYRLLLKDDVFWLTLKNTLIYAALAIPGALFIGVGLAMLLNAKIRGQGVYRAIIFLPSLVPVVASSMIWMWILNAKVGLVNFLLAKVGIAGPAWLTGFYAVHASPLFYWAMPSLVLISFWGVGNAVVIYLAGLQDIPAELYEAAELDGASPLGRMLNLTLPMLSPVIFFNLIMGI